MGLTQKQMVMGGAAAAGLLLAWVATRGARAVAQDTARGIVGIAEGTVTGVVVGIGEAIGVPPTRPTQCQADKAAGRTWDASFSCPAGDFIRYVFN